MLVTAVRFAKPKSKYVMLLMESSVTGQKKISFKEKGQDKKEILAMDPHIRLPVIYREVKKVRTMRGKFKVGPDYNVPKFDDDGNLLPDRRYKKRMIPTLD